MKLKWVPVPVLLWVLAVASPEAGQGISQARLADWLTSGSIGVKQGALSCVRGIPPEKREPALENALISELERLNKERYERALLVRAGKEYTPENADGTERSGEYRLELTAIVGQSANPKTIPVLIGALGSGTVVNKALAKFGQLAVEPLVKIALSDHPRADAVADAIRSLQQVIEGGKPLSYQARDRILTVAVERLTGAQYFLYVWSAIDLAIATKDASLRRRVEQLANDPQQIRQMGISDPSLEKYVRDAATRALARKSE